MSELRTLYGETFEAPRNALGCLVTSVYTGLPSFLRAFFSAACEVSFSICPLARVDAPQDSELVNIAYEACRSEVLLIN